jgi:D-3-phosphoglycerate dehydrogenase
LGRLVAALADSPISELVIRLSGRIAEYDSRPVAAEAVAGLLSKRLSGRVNRVNAMHLARMQGMAVRESRSQDAKDYLSLVEIAATGGETSLSVAGTLLGGRHPRLVRIDGYELEAALEGHMLFTRHEDRPGVVGALGSILGREHVNISRMQVGAAETGKTAIALIGISRPLSPRALAEIRALPPIAQVVEIDL